MAAALLLVAQRPVDYQIPIGVADGPSSDLPFVQNWNSPEHIGDRYTRWTKDISHILVGGLPRETLIVEMTLLPANAHPLVGAGHVTIASQGETIGAVPLAPSMQRLHLLAPPRTISAGKVDITISAPPWSPGGDPRTLGVLVDDVRLRSAALGPSGVERLMRVPLAIFWPILALPIIWVPLRRWTVRPIALGVVAILCGLLLLAFAADPPRFALTGPPLLIGLGWGLALAVGLRKLAAAVSARLGVAPSPPLLNYIALLCFALFTLRYSGRIYPESMLGDVGFHVNRQNDVIRGGVLLLSRHRGIDFPYPPALYVLLLPFRLLPIYPETLVEFAAALCAPLGLLPLTYIALRSFDDERIARFAAAVYALLAAPIMALWWSFLPHIFAQEFAVLLLAGLVGGWAGLRTGRGVLLATVGLVVLWTSHFGFYLNVSVVVALVALFALVQRRAANDFRWRGRDWPSLRGLVIAFGLAQGVVWLVFYSAYLPLFWAQARTLLAGGMGAVQGGRAAIPRAALLQILWQAGLVAHYAAVGLPLALLGGYQLWAERRAPILRLVFAATVALAVVQAVMPFLTSSTVTTRWLSFLAWLVALGLGLLLDRLWRSGRAGRLAAILVLSWIGLTTLWMWVQALAYRVRPPEPF